MSLPSGKIVSGAISGGETYIRRSGGWHEARDLRGRVPFCFRTTEGGIQQHLRFLGEWQYQMVFLHICLVPACRRCAGESVRELLQKVTVCSVMQCGLLILLITGFDVCWTTSQSLILPLARGYHSSKSQLSSYQLSPLLFTITISDYPSQIITSSTLVPD